MKNCVLIYGGKMKIYDYSEIIDHKISFYILFTIWRNKIAWFLNYDRIK